MEEIACLFCGTREQPVAITENGFKGRKCDGCGLVYISPRPSEEEVHNLYSHEQAVSDADVQFGFDSVNRLGARAVLRHIKRYKPGGSLLELGSGGGFFVAEARDQGYDPYAVELNPIEAKWINAQLKIPCEDVPLGDRSFGGRKFDIIYHRDVLSHLPDPVATFRQVNRALKDGGLHVFETGNIGDVEQKYYKYFSQFSYPDHLFFFGERSIRSLLEKTGFRTLRVVRKAIFLQLLVQKSLWGMKDRLKDKNGAAIVTQQVPGGRGGKSAKRTLRKLYRYASFGLVTCGKVLPTKGRPLKLIVYAVKQSPA